MAVSSASLHSVEVQRVGRFQFRGICHDCHWHSLPESMRERAVCDVLQHQLGNQCESVT